MRAFIIALSLFYSISALATTPALTMPTLQQVDVLACSSPSIEYQLTGETVSGGPIGILFEQTKCTQHSGRGGGTTAFHSSCSYVTWNTDGSISSVEVLTTTISRSALSLTVCLNQT